MHLGMFMMPVHAPDKPWGQALSEDREAVVLADRLGFSDAANFRHAFKKWTDKTPSAFR